MRLTCALFALLLLPLAARAEVVQYPAPAGAAAATDTLVIYSTTDIAQAEPLITGYQRAHRGTAVTYHELNSLELYDRYLEETRAAAATADLMLSSAMDLQIKLVNDGYALRYAPPASDELPAWANWRDEAFGFTFEPAVIVYNKALVPEAEVPRSRFDLIRLLEEKPEAYFGKIATYDPERSGLGFLLATQDSKQSQSIWHLASRFGVSGVKLYSNTAAILDRIASGQFLIGYNLVGSYALARAAANPDIGIILPSDYTLVTSRIAFIPKNAQNTAAARAFMDFLLSVSGQEIIATESRLYSIHPRVTGDVTAAALRARPDANLRPIRIGPGLLVFLDQVKRQKFLRDWHRALGGRLPKGVNPDS